MNFLSRFFKSRPELNERFDEFLRTEQFATNIKPVFSEAGVVYELNPNIQINTAIDLMNVATSSELGSLQLIYFAQLASEDLASINQKSVFIAWKSLYSLLKDLEHQTSLKLLELPDKDTSRPTICEVGTVADTFFHLQLTGWRSDTDGKISHKSWVGGVLAQQTNPRLMTGETWELLNYLSINNGFENLSRTCLLYTSDAADE